MRCSTEGCLNEVVKFKTQQCKGCYDRSRPREQLDNLRVSLCAGGCGKRLHNLRFVKVPGISQGRGPDRAWCHVCVLKYKPVSYATRTVRDRGKCKSCKRPMTSGTPPEGHMKHHGKGLCTGCYNRHQARSRRGINAGEKNTWARLNAEQVMEIRQRHRNGEKNVALAREYSVTANNISSIVLRKSWQHLPDPV